MNKHQIDEVSSPLRTVKKQLIELENSSPYARKVAQHYNQNQSIGSENRNKSRIFGVRSFNNGIKAYLISEIMDIAASKMPNDYKLTVLDIACGKGGDLYKWQRRNVGKVVCADIASVSLEECQKRYHNIKHYRSNIYECEFIHADCTRDILRRKYQNANTQFDIVSCQFALHYSFESYDQLKVMLQNVSDNLKVGGYFVGTIPNSNEIMKRLMQSSNRQFGNKLYEISMKNCPIDPPDLFGAQYYFKLAEAVDCPEFLIYFPLLVDIAKYFNLKLIRDPTFEHYFFVQMCGKRDTAYRMKMLSMFPNNPEKLSKKPDLKHILEYFQTHPESNVIIEDGKRDKKCIIDYTVAWKTVIKTNGIIQKMQCCTKQQHGDRKWRCLFENMWGGENGPYQKIVSEVRKLTKLRSKMNDLLDFLSKTNENLDLGSQSNNDSLWITGRKYDPFLDIERIIHEIQSKLWFTYRKGFEPIGDSEGPSSDKGWGCMLRCGQMLLANALIVTHLGDEFIWKTDTSNSTYINIVQKFEDFKHAPFSIHKIALAGQSEGKEIGQWFGPNTVSQVLKKLVEMEQCASLSLHVAMDNILIKSEIPNWSQNDNWKPLLLIVPLRLGLDEINKIYCPCIKSFFEIEQSFGLIGGKPNSALYFIGYCEDHIYYLDPHHTQKSGSIGFKETEEQMEFDQTYHCKNISKMLITKIDPSLAFCFYCKTRDDFEKLCNIMEDKLVLSDKNQQLIEIYDDRPSNLTYVSSDSPPSSLIFEIDDIKNSSSDNDFEII